MVSPKYSRISSTGRNENNKEQSSIDSNIHSNSNSKTTTDQSLHFSCFNNQSHTMTKLTNQTMTRGIIPSSVACVASVSAHTKTFSIFDRARIGGQKSKVFICSSYAWKRLLRRLHHLMHDDSSLDSEDDYHSGSPNGQSPTTVFLKITLTQTTTQGNQLLILGSNHLPKIIIIYIILYIIIIIMYLSSPKYVVKCVSQMHVTVEF